MCENISKNEVCGCSQLYSNEYNCTPSYTITRGGSCAEWSRQVEECRSSGLSVRSWCEQHHIAVSTFHYRQQKVWKALQKSSQFVEVPLSFDESHNNNIAASVRVGSICAEVHNGADEATLAALFRVLKSC